VKIAREAKPAVQISHDNRQTVLVVDDFQAGLEALCLLLRDKGFAVTAASTTTGALRAMVEQEFDLVITDLVMCVDFGAAPEADGREIALAAKRSSEKTKVIVFTGFPQMSKDLIKAGVDAVISKASSSIDFFKRIEDLLGRP
jgi:CheY-like chemotaxis protein